MTYPGGRGSLVGIGDAPVGASVGVAVGAPVGAAVGDVVGFSVGESDGAVVGDSVRGADGDMVGDGVGAQSWPQVSGQKRNTLFVSFRYVASLPQ